MILSQPNATNSTEVKKMRIEPLAIPDVVRITTPRFVDNRGFFSATWNDCVFRQRVADVTFVQDNHSLSRLAGTIRGLHFQRPPFAQGKLVRVTRGAAFDVAVDLRQGSRFFGQYASAVLTAEAGEQLWIPEGFAHGFCTLEPETELFYKVTNSYSEDNEGGVIWSDPDLVIDWPVAIEHVILSDKDRALSRLAELPSIFNLSELS
jgi:dTDP-4-dehydrorhamnose 3,5-epimerase